MVLSVLVGEPINPNRSLLRNLNRGWFSAFWAWLKIYQPAGI